MKYISHSQALNLPCKLNTCGDWHTCNIDWSAVNYYESCDSVFGDWGIEIDVVLLDGSVANVADHLRAILDILEEGKIIKWLYLFKDDYLCTDEYDCILFEKVILLRHVGHWDEINKLMEHEFLSEWDNFMRGTEGC